MRAKKLWLCPFCDREIQPKEKHDIGKCSLEHLGAYLRNSSTDRVCMSCGKLIRKGIPHNVRECILERSDKVLAERTRLTEKFDYSINADGTIERIEK